MLTMIYLLKSMKFRGIISNRTVCEDGGWPINNRPRPERPKPEKPKPEKPDFIKEGEFKV